MAGRGEWVADAWQTYPEERLTRILLRLQPKGLASKDACAARKIIKLAEEVVRVALHCGSPFHHGEHVLKYA